MAGTVPSCARAAKAGVDIIIAQGTEGGGHVGWMGSMPLIPMVVDAVAPIPVLRPAGLRTGVGSLRCCRLVPTVFYSGHPSSRPWNCPLHPNFKQAIVESDGHDTQLSEIPDIAAGLVWPGAMTRCRRDLLHRTLGRAGMGTTAMPSGRDRSIAGSASSGDGDEGPLSMGQDAGPIHDIPRAADIVSRIALEAEEILTRKLPGLLAGAT